MTVVKVAQIQDKFGDHAYKMLPLYCREEDSLKLTVITGVSATEELKFHHRFMRSFGGAYDDILAIIKTTLNWFDALGAPAAILPYLSSNQGWPLDSTLPESLQRQIVRHVYKMVYMGRGNLDSIAKAIVAFTGIQCRVWSPNADPRRMIMCRKVGTTTQPLGMGSIQGAVEHAHVAAMLSAVSAGDRVIFQCGSTVETGVVYSVSGTDLAISGGLRHYFPAGTTVLAMPSRLSSGPSWSPYRIGKARLAHSQAPYYMKMGHNSTNNMFGGSARLAWHQNQRSCTDDERRIRFTFYIEIPIIVSAVESWKLEIMNTLADYMRPARTHYVIRHTDSGLTERWFRVGISRLNDRSVIWGGP